MGKIVFPALHRLLGIIEKLNRAKEHIANLDRAIEAFLHGSPYSVSVKSNPQTGYIEWVLDESRDIPASISLIAGDAINNLRSTLDHLAWQPVLANHGEPDTNTAFPISKSAEEYASPKTRGKVKGMRPEVIAAIDALEPYQGGNDTLWRLHRLNNIDKHRLLLSAAAAMASHDLLPSQRADLIRLFGDISPRLKGVTIGPSNARFPLEKGKVFFSMPESDMEHNFKFRLGIAFNEPRLVEGEPILETIQHFSDLVENIVSNFAPFLA